jgi:hypothetical protein
MSKWSEIEVQSLQETYDPSAPEDIRKEQMENLAKRFDRSVQQIRSKLVSMGLYVSQSAKKSKSEGKEEYIRALQAIMNDREGVLEGLEKATKQSLKFVTDYIVKISDQYEAGRK